MQCTYFFTGGEGVDNNQTR